MSTDRPTWRAFVLPALLVVAGVPALSATACNGHISQLAPYEATDGAGGTPLDGGSYAATGGTSGDLDPFATGGETFVTTPKPPHQHSGQGGANGTWDVPSSVQLERCEPTTAEPTELPSTPEASCNYLEIGLPGVMEYSIDPSSIDLDEARADGWYLYEGCDEVGSPCVGRIEYQWDVEYLADNEWYVSFAPVRTACDYDHVAVYETPTGELAARGALAWAPCELTVHLQPTALGLSIGAVRSATDEALDVFACTVISWSESRRDPRGSGLFLDALVEHLQSLEWECQH